MSYFQRVQKYALSIVCFLLLAGCVTIYIDPDNRKVTLTDTQSSRITETVDIINAQQHEFTERHTHNWMFKRIHYVISARSVVSQFHAALIREFERQGGHVRKDATKSIMIWLQSMDITPPTQVLDVVTSATFSFQLGEKKPFVLRCVYLKNTFFRSVEKTFKTTLTGCLKRSLNKLFKHPEFRKYVGMQEE